MPKFWFALAALAAFMAAGCGSQDDGATSMETKPSEVKQNIDQGTQDKIAADLKNWKPTK
jgi:hypothetical protein